MNKTWPKVLFFLKLNNNNRMLSSTVTTRWQNIGSGGATLKLQIKIVVGKVQLYTSWISTCPLRNWRPRGIGSNPSIHRVFSPSDSSVWTRNSAFLFFSFLSCVFFFLPWEAESVAKVLLGENFSHSEWKGGELKRLPCLSLPSFLCSVPLVPLTWEKTLQWKTEFYSNPEETVWLSEAKT